MIQVVLLDFDDTLCMSEESCFYFENDIARQMGFPAMTREIHKSNWGHPLQEAIKERIPGINAEKFMKLVEQQMPEYIEKEKLDTISDANIKVLDKLKAAGKKLAILTSRSLGEVKHLLHENYPLNGRIDAFYHRDNVEYIKPDPRVFNDALYQFDVLPEKCLYVGDSPSDAVAAKGAGMHFIAVLEAGIRTKKDFVGENVDFYAEKFTDILPYILSH